MALSYFIQTAGFMEINGLSTDTKPASPGPNWTFAETDTAKFYRVVAGVWTESLNQAYTTPAGLTDANIAFTDIATNDASITKHGFLQKLPGGTVNFLRADGTFASPTASAAWGSITGTLSTQSDLQTALDAKQPLDSDLTTIAGLTATTDNFIVAAASAWASRTPAQAKTSLALVKGDVGLSSVDNTTDAAKPVSTAQQTALDAKLDDSQATAFGLSLLDDADAAAGRTTLGLGTLATQSGTFSGTASGTNTGDQTLPTDATLSFSDITTNDSSLTKHGFAPKLPGGTSTFYRADGAFAAPGGGSDPWTYTQVNGGADFTTTSATAVDVTGLSFTPVANTTYEFEAVLLLRTATALVNPRVGLAWATGGVDGVAMILESQAVNTIPIAANGNINAALLIAVGGLPNTTQSWPATVRGTFRAGASPSGTVRMQLASETAGTTVRIVARSFLKYRTLPF